MNTYLLCSQNRLKISNINLDLKNVIVFNTVRTLNEQKSNAILYIYIYNSTFKTKSNKLYNLKLFCGGPIIDINAL